MAIQRVKQKGLELLLNQTLYYLEKNPEKNFKKIVGNLTKLSKLLPLPLFKQQIAEVKKLADNDRPGIHLLYNVLEDTEPEILQKLAHNFILNAAWLGIVKQRSITKETGINIPWFLLIDPTERCNYNCKGCWAGSYKQAKEMSRETFNRIMKQAKKLGIYYIVVSGGEPTLWRHLFDMFQEHNDMAFMMYTNGSLFTKEFVKRLADVGNVIPCFSIEGFKEKTDARRGEGAWNRVMTAMDNMKDAGVPFGYSITQTCDNVEEVMSDKFVKFMVEKGSKIAWYFQYIPVGRTPDIKLMLSPKQRMDSYERIHHIRANYPLFAADFWNDGPYTGGCIAGARRYLHITANGGIEPCAFIHLSQGNINEISLEEALQLPFFQEIQKLQPYSSNLMRPCLLVDDPDNFRKIASLPNVKSTNGTVENMNREVGKHLDKLSKEWKDLSDPVFEKDFPDIARKTKKYKEKKEKLLKEHNGNFSKVIQSEDLE